MDPNTRRALLDRLASVLGGPPVVESRRNAGGTLTIDVATVPDCPEPGAVTCSTVGLSEHPLFDRGRPFPARVEVIAAVRASPSTCAAMAASTAFHVIGHDWLCAPGSWLENALDGLGVTGPMRHLYVTAPFFWGERLNRLEIDRRLITWVLVVPISDAELGLLRKEGDERFESALEEAGVDILDPLRPSAW